VLGRAFTLGNESQQRAHGRIAMMGAVVAIDAQGNQVNRDIQLLTSAHALAPQVMANGRTATATMAADAHQSTRQQQVRV
jgi:hypothetical protein